MLGAVPRILLFPELLCADSFREQPRPPLERPSGRFADRRLTKRVKVLMKGATPLKVYSLNAPAKLPGVDFSDHRNYWAQGYNAVMITDTAFYRNPNYHELTDTWDTLDYGRMAHVVQAVFNAVKNLP